MKSAVKGKEIDIKQTIKQISDDNGANEGEVLDNIPSLGLSDPEEVTFNKKAEGWRGETVRMGGKTSSAEKMQRLTEGKSRIF